MTHSPTSESMRHHGVPADEAGLVDAGEHEAVDDRGVGGRARSAPATTTLPVEVRVRLAAGSKISSPPGWICDAGDLGVDVEQDRL